MVAQQEPATKRQPARRRRLTAAVIMIVVSVAACSRFTILTGAAAATPEFSCAPNALPAYTPPEPPVHPLPALPLHTSGSKILTASGAPFKVAAVNWYGAEGADFVPSGLDQLTPKAIASSIWSMGYNAVRLPWSNQMLECNPTITNPATVAANPAFVGKTAMAVFDAVVNALVHQGLLVVLDDHMTDAEWCCDANDNNGLWWSSNENNCVASSVCDPTAGTAHWQADWATLIQRYVAVQAVAGFDLRNQPRTYAQWSGASNSPTSCPAGGSACNWPSAATALGNLLLTDNPNLGLLFVEGIDYGVNLTGAFSNGIGLNAAGHLVYSAHAYSFSDYCHPQVDSQCISSSPWSPVSDWSTVSQSSFDESLDSQWGFLSEQGTAPVWVGEFGTSQPCGPSAWFTLMSSYLATTNFSWSYWAVNGTQENSGAAPGTQNYLQQHRPLSLLTPEPYGVLTTDWGGAPKKALQSVLTNLQMSPVPTLGTCAPDPALSVVDLSRSGITAAELAIRVAGGGVATSNAQLTGAADAVGTFKGGHDSVNIDQGVVLSSGDAASTMGTTTTTAVSTNNGQPGDNALLSSYVGGLPTYDAAELAFDFVPSGATVSLTYAFGSAEYDLYANSQFDDIAAVIVDGQNCAQVPGTTSPVTINNLNDSTLESTTNTSNSQFFVANDPNYWAVASYGTALHGLGIPFTCTASVTPGVTNHIVIAIADVSDAILDSDVFVKLHSLISPGVGVTGYAAAHGAGVRHMMPERR